MKRQKKPECKISKKSLRDAFNVKLSDSSALRIQRVLNEELYRIRNAPPKPVMTLIEVADYLRTTQETVENNLDEIPCFEFGGKLLFRKEAVDEWIREREVSYAQELSEFNMNKFRKITIA